MNLARRLFFSRAAGAVAAAPMIARDAVAVTERQRGALWQFSQAMKAEAAVPSLIGETDPWSVTQRIIRKSGAQREREQRKYRAELAGGLDPNIAALRSVALQHKIGMQIDRDTKRIQEQSSFIANALRLAGVPEDEIWRHIEHY